MSFIVEKQAATVLPPTKGSTLNVAVTTAVTILDVTTIPSTKAWPYITNTGPAGGSVPDPSQINPTGKYLRISAQGGGVYFVFGPTFAGLAGVNAGSATAVSGANGAVTLTLAEMDYVPDGGFKDVLVSPGTAPKIGADSPTRFLALITLSGTASARIYQASP